MRPGMQTAWVQEVPRENFQCGPRINLTFRGLLRWEVTDQESLW